GDHYSGGAEIAARTNLRRARGGARRGADARRVRVPRCPCSEMFSVCASCCLLAVAGLVLVGIHRATRAAASGLKRVDSVSRLRAHVTSTTACVLPITKVR